MPKQQMLETPDSSSDPTCVNEGSQEALSRVGLLSASTLHDLRNPLGAIYAASEMLIQVDAGPTQVKRLATNIYRAAGRMRELLADLTGGSCGNRSTSEICKIRDVIIAASEVTSPAAKE